MNPFGIAMAFCIQNYNLKPVKILSADLKQVQYFTFVAMATQSTRLIQIFPYLSTSIKTSASDPEAIQIAKTSQMHALKNRANL